MQMSKSGAVVLVAITLVVSCKGEKSQGSTSSVATAEVRAAPPVPTADENPFKRSLDEARAKATMGEAMAVAKPYMTEEFGKVSAGGLIFAAWASDKMTWSDAQPPKDETSIALVMKDPDEARGKRLCAPGRIIQISVDKTPYGKMNTGLLGTGAGNLIHFMAMKSSGTLVERSPARLCGVVTGKYDYSNSGGGTGHAVQMIGLFDLPENK